MKLHSELLGLGLFPAGAGPAQSFTLFQGGPREAKRISPSPN